MPNLNERKARPSQHELLAKRIDDLKGYVLMEQALPEKQQVPITRLHAMVSSWLSDFKRQNIQRSLPQTA